MVTDAPQLLFHVLFMREGIRNKLDAHFFLPLLRSRRVLANLMGMLGDICGKLEWQLPSMDDLRSPTYANDKTYYVRQKPLQPMLQLGKQ